jgi:hypothetical protein
MFTALSPNARRSDLGRQKIARRQRVRKGLRLLKRRINRAVRNERENAVIYRLLARRFPSDSDEASLLRLLGRSALRRVKRLKGLLAEFHAMSRPLQRTWRFYGRRLHALYAPRRWALLSTKDGRGKN